MIVFALDRVVADLLSKNMSVVGRMGALLCKLECVCV